MRKHVYRFANIFSQCDRINRPYWALASTSIANNFQCLLLESFSVTTPIHTGWDLDLQTSKKSSCSCWFLWHFSRGASLLFNCFCEVCFSFCLLRVQFIKKAFNQTFKILKNCIHLRTIEEKIIPHLPVFVNY